jgi:hypothetical protein
MFFITRWHSDSGMQQLRCEESAYVVLTDSDVTILAEGLREQSADEARSKNSTYRQKIAGSVQRIAQYAATSHGVNVASAASKPSGL